MNIFRNYGEKDQWGGSNATRINRRIELAERLTWIYGSAADRMASEAWKADVAAWKRLAGRVR